MFGLGAVILIGVGLVIWRHQDSEPRGAAGGDRPIDWTQARAQAEQGDAAAQAALGAAYASGNGLPLDYVKALEWFRQAAAQGHPEAEFNMGVFCETGQGVPHDDAQAAVWYEKAAERGHLAAQYSLASMYGAGRGVPYDEAKAVQWYRRAAECGDSLSQYNLGRRYERGKGVAVDRVEAYQWLSLALAGGVEDAAKDRDAVAARMSAEERAVAGRRVKEFVPKPAGVSGARPLGR